MELCSVAVIKSILEEHGLRMQKSLGQNFLINPDVPCRIAESVADADTVLEIGPGIGCLTSALAERLPHVIAVELDSGLIPVLRDTLSGFDNTEIIHGDIMKTDLTALLCGRERVAVCANLPYYITTPILMSLVECGFPFTGITVMVQAEVAARLSALPGTAEYGAITAALSAYGTVRRLFSVPAGNFYPAPHVDSAVVQVVPRKEKLRVNDPALFRETVRAAFAQRRKTLANALSSAMPRLSKSDAAAVVTSLGFSPDIRGERLSADDFARLADAIADMG